MSEKEVQIENGTDNNSLHISFEKSIDTNTENESEKEEKSQTPEETNYQNLDLENSTDEFWTEQ